MSQLKYISIDKSIIAEGCAYDFALFYAINNNKQVKELKPKGVIIDDSDLLFIEKTKSLFITEHEHPVYEDYYKNFLRQKKPKIATKGQPLTFAQKLDSLYKNASIALNELFSNPEKLSNYKESKKVVNDLVNNVLDEEFAIKSLMKIATHDYYTHTHSINVSIYALSLGHFLGFSKTELEDLGEAALLHDLGKSKIDKEIINKKGKLTSDEFKIMQRHPVYGVSLCLKLGISNKKVLEGIKYHHEKLNGSGYPNGLYGEEIPLYAKIVGICDIFDALTSERSYKKAMTSFEALKLMKTNMGKELDVELLNKMILMFR
jgi:HD-GYP domain-containing protein (c-di-GMP phosphodiesterase class II)